MCICARHFYTKVWSTQINFYPKVSLTHLPHLGFLASLSCAKLRFLSLAEQCHTLISLDCTGNISADPERNLLKFHVLHNTVNVNPRLTLKHDICTGHARLKLTCTGNFSAATELNLLIFETLHTADNFNNLQTSINTQFVHTWSFCAHAISHHLLNRNNLNFKFCLTKPMLAICQLWNIIFAACWFKAYVHRKYL